LQFPRRSYTDQAEDFVVLARKMDLKQAFGF